jgi:hypothetical protein
MDSFWQEINSPGLAQGDMLPACAVPIIRADFDRTVRAADTPSSIDVDEFDLVIMTQSCDLENGKAPLVACCPICSVVEFEAANIAYAGVGEWEKVRQGRVEGLHLLASTTAPNDKWAAYVVDFRSIFSLPVAYLTAHAEQLPSRWRLRSPYLEHFSQAFARFFMRVGLPSAIPPYNVDPNRPPQPHRSPTA